MAGGMIDAVRGCLKEEMRMDVISNNLANANMVGFKKDVISFQDLLRQNGGGNAGANAGAAAKNDPAMVQIKTDVSPGDIRHTGNALDFAITGEGFFKVETEDGIRYTRKGNFTLNEQGLLVTQQGQTVMGEGGPITLSGNRIDVDGRGVIKVDGSEEGRIDVVVFDDDRALVKDGLGCFRNEGEAPEMPAPDDSRVQQGYLELSNVNIAEEMVNMIHAMRAFESYQKAIRILDGVNNKAINDVSRLR